MCVCVRQRERERETSLHESSAQLLLARPLECCTGHGLPNESLHVLADGFVCALADPHSFRHELVQQGCQQRRRNAWPISIVRRGARLGRGGGGGLSGSGGWARSATFRTHRLERFGFRCWVVSGRHVGADRVCEAAGCDVLMLGGGGEARRVAFRSRSNLAPHGASSRLKIRRPLKARRWLGCGIS